MVGDGGGYEQGVGDSEQCGAGADGNGGLAVSVGGGEEEDGFGDDGAVGTGPG